MVHCLRPPSYTDDQVIGCCNVCSRGFTYPEKFSECRVVRLARLPLDVFLIYYVSLVLFDGLENQTRTKSFVNQKRSTSSIRPRPSSESPMLHGNVSRYRKHHARGSIRYKCFWPVKIVPVL